MRKKSIKKIFQAVAVLCILSLLLTGTAYSGKLSDLWGKVIKKYPAPVPTQQERDSLAWAYEQLAKASPQEAFQKKDFTPEDEIEPTPPPRPDYQDSKITHKQLLPFKELIRRASIQFDVPQKIIGAIILQESSGNPKAKAPTSSAKGLMQTINATFKFAKNHLAKADPPIYINNPYKPKDSISAGTWYISYVFELAKQDYPKYNDRKNIKVWKKALEYYYAGPNWGKSPNDVVHAKIGKKTIVIKKAWYANKVLKRAYKL